jgi:UDP-N-acetyl-D-mannosaminuronic acid dehydrogenase
MRSLCVIGLGYIGLPTAGMFATHGLNVHGMDNNQDIVSRLEHNDVHIEEPGLKQLISNAIDSGHFMVSNKVKPSDAYIVAVPTPFIHDKFGEYDGKKYKLSDMQAVISATQSIVPHLKKGDLVILESTSPVRTTVDLIKPILEKSGLYAGKDFYLAYSPERVLPGQIIRELEENSRVIGGIDEQSSIRGKELYSHFVKGEIVLTDSSTAEMVKLMENTYRDVNIAIANEFSRLSDRFGINVWEAIEIANRHPRVKILNPGPGVGGHCVSVDPWFLVESAPDITSLIHTARQVNDSQPRFVVQLAELILGELKGKKIAILGLSYKPDVDDFRESPAVEIVEILLDLGCEVCIFDPYAKSFKSFENNMMDTVEDAVKDSDLVLLLVDHAEFKSLKPNSLIGMRGRKILDTRHCLDKIIWQESGFKINCIGDSK